MSIGNPALAEVLAKHGSSQQMLAAIAERGVLVAVRPDRSVVLGTTQSGERVLLGYTVPATYSRHGGRYALSLCDADTIVDIQRVTGVREVVVDAAGPTTAAVPIDDIHRYLMVNRSGPVPAVAGPPPSAYATGAMAPVARRSVGAPLSAPAPAPPAGVWIPSPREHLSGPMPKIDHGFERSKSPLLPRIRSAIARLLIDFPLVHHVWICDVRTPSGAPGLMLLVKVHSAIADEIVADLHQSLRARVPELAASGAPVVMARVADASTERRMVEIGAAVVCADVRE